MDRGMKAHRKACRDGGLDLPYLPGERSVDAGAIFRTLANVNWKRVVKRIVFFLVVLGGTAALVYMSNKAWDRKYGPEALQEFYDETRDDPRWQNINSGGYPR